MAALCLARLLGLTADVQSLVHAEREFAAFAQAKGVKTAFLQYMAPEAVTFIPSGLVSARESMRDRPEGEKGLSWWPLRAELSRSGDLGWTSGPWQFSKDGKVIARGTFLTVWQRQKDGSWRWLIDAGIAHRESYADSIALREVQLSLQPPVSKGVEDAEDGFIRLWKEQGDATAFKRALGKDPLLLRESYLPSGSFSPSGKMESLDRVTTVAATSKDLAATWGTQVIDGRKCGYIRVWRNEGGTWKVAVDRLAPIT